ncbi:MAG: 2-amino-3,7-dideoxy-D-threo-hept-6-ulosonate synthase [Halobacteriota archaeon]|uniref:2-amino-3,7-dideoxy-D-threo-hept-6-ulosonate synthase n=1 Tax=Halodesulfurarchaeum sp. HSR-GB TaxID=3074077 RepID=UPI0028613983|nr:2-amino-3,7-dideoxy-D-threo-hept-6-ulosonate synthase [Halodesulfurarchaeum sp. HSR-GB]MDR5656785.1 2-amino-3,7-dideoxy-D-threo-hept-6-ulosonate synthase [Halodesulfurarchaeum sp. HSR-GB]
MSTGVEARLTRLGRDGKFVTVPMDHGITMGAVDGLKDIESTIADVTEGGADAVLTQKGLADRVYPNRHDAGYLVHLNGSTEIGPDEAEKRQTATVEEAVRLGADGVSFHINVGSDHEPDQIEALSNVTERAHQLGMPVLAMAYARGPGIDEHDATNLGHAVRLAEELGADIIKTAYSGDPESFEHVVESTSKPVIIAGGSPSSDRETLETVQDAVSVGGAGVSMGRTIFQHPDPYAISSAIAAVVHEGFAIDVAMDRFDLPIEP